MKKPIEWHTAKDNALEPSNPCTANINGAIKSFNGLTKREWLAGMADVPWNAVIDAISQHREAMGQSSLHPIRNDELLEYRAKLMVLQADALLAELAKK